MLLNRRLLEKVRRSYGYGTDLPLIDQHPNAEIVITEDADWMSVITDVCRQFPSQVFHA